MSQDPYADGALYDLEYADHAEDIRFYVDRARTGAGPTLELGCGTGRLTLPIARAGLPILGLDRAPSMLAALRRKLEAEPPAVRTQVEVQEADYLSFEPNQAFATVLWPFNALHHCADLDQLTTALQRFRSWLMPNGRLALDGYLPDLALYDRDPEGRYEPRHFVDAYGSALQSWEQGWWDAETRVHHVVYVYVDEAGAETRTHLQLRMFDLSELHAAAHAAGFAVLREASDFRNTLLGRDALKWVAVLRPR